MLINDVAMVMVPSPAVSRLQQKTVNRDLQYCLTYSTAATPTVRPDLQYCLTYSTAATPTVLPDLQSYSLTYTTARPMLTSQ